jgi:hypothetical protein
VHFCGQLSGEAAGSLAAPCCVRRTVTRWGDRSSIVIRGHHATDRHGGIFLDEDLPGRLLHLLDEIRILLNEQM